MLTSQVVGCLGPLEYILNTPSHHRVHHGIISHLSGVCCVPLILSFTLFLAYSLFHYLSMSLSLFVCQSVCQSVCLSVCLSVSLSLSVLSVCLSFTLIHYSPALSLSVSLFLSLFASFLRVSCPFNTYFFHVI